MATLQSLATNRTSLVVLVLVLVFLLGGSLASRGDESVQFRSCVSRCREVERGESDAAAAVVVPRCHEDGASAPEARVPFSWDCESECQYRCMWAIEGERA